MAFDPWLHGYGSNLSHQSLFPFTFGFHFGYQATFAKLVAIVEEALLLKKMEVANKDPVTPKSLRTPRPQPPKNT